MSNESAIRRELGPWALMFTGLSSIIGSGWLFGAWRAAGLAGPGAIWAWLLGAVIVSLIALSYAELGAMFPESGGTVRYAHYSHGSLLGFFSAWTNWIGITAPIPAEAEASVQYMASWPWAWAQRLYQYVPDGHGELSATGLGISGLLVIGYFLLNFWSVKLLARSNTAIAIFKLVVPLLAALSLLASGFHADNLHVPLHPGGHLLDLPAILTTVATAGIIFSFNGFQSPVNLAGEAKHPGRNLPLAVMGSIAIATVLYVLLQIAYIGAVPPDTLAKLGWHGIDFRSPFAELALLLGLHWLATLLYLDAFISPSGTGIIYTAASARMLYGMQRNGTMPAFLGRIHPRYGIPRAALWIDLALAFVFLLLFRGWGAIAAVISVSHVIGYLTGPVSVVSLRRTAPHLKRPLRVIGIRFISALAFVSSTELLYWAHWPFTGEIILLMMIGLPIYFYYQAKHHWQGFHRQLRGAAWMILYLPAIATISWAGSRTFGGHGYIPYGWDLLLAGLLGLIFYLWGIHSGWTTEDIAKIEPAISKA